MPSTLTGGLKDMLSANTLRFTRVYRLTRSDGVILRFAEHPYSIVYNGETFDPVDGIDVQADETFAGMKEANSEMLGILSSSRIDEDDLRGGLYRDARIDVITLDWRYPWMGVLDQRVFWLGQITRITGETFTAELLGLGSWLSQSTGVVAGRTCRFNLGDSACNRDGKTDLTGAGPWLQQGKIVTAVDTQRVQFQTDATGADGYLDRGEITWTGPSGDKKVGTKNQVKTHVSVNGVLTLQLPSDFDINVGDEFSVYPGCNKIFDGDCTTKFANQEVFGGQRFIPGGDSANETPEES